MDFCLQNFEALTSSLQMALESSSNQDHANGNDASGYAVGSDSNTTGLNSSQALLCVASIFLYLHPSSVKYSIFLNSSGCSQAYADR
jgi:hypothetical protein